MLEEEPLVTKSARDDLRSGANVRDVLDARLTPESTAIVGNVLRHHPEQNGALRDILQLLVEGHLSPAHKLPRLRPQPPQVLVRLEPEVEGEVDAGVHLLSASLPASELGQTYGSDLSGRLDELGPYGVLEAVVGEVWDDRAEVVGKKVEAVDGLKARVCQ